MPITKIKSEIIADKAAIEIREATTGAYETVGYVDGESEVNISEQTIDIEDGEHAIGYQIEAMFNMLQFTDASITAMEIYTPKKVDVRFTGSNKVIEIVNCNFFFGVNAKFNRKDALKFPAKVSGFCKKVSDGINIT